MASKKLRIGVVGLVHDHVWNILEYIRKIEGVEIPCASDVNEPLLAKIKELGVKRTYTSHEELIASEEIDAVLVYTENSVHADVTELAAETGLHVMVEKPMAANLKQAERMLSISRKADIKLMINYPTAWSPRIRHAYTLAKKGLIGTIYQIRYRAAHQGPKEMGCSSYFYEWLYNKKLNGAGAFMDYCCYGANMSRWILGFPAKAIALGGTYVRDYLAVEDNALLLMGYKKAMGIAEASWSQIGDGVPPRYTLIINGSEGNIAAGPKELVVYTMETEAWEKIKAPPLKEGERNAPEHFVECVRKDKSIDDMVSAEYSRDVQAILEAGLTSMREERVVHLNELT